MLVENDLEKDEVKEGAHLVFTSGQEHINIYIHAI